MAQNGKRLIGVKAKAPIYLIEHGQTDFDTEHRVHGKVDEPLNDTGRKQAHSLGVRLQSMAKPPDVIYASDRKRARETAHIASRVSGIPVKLAPELRPLNVGNFSGQNEGQVAEKLRPYFAAPFRTIPGGENVSGWRARHRGFVRKVAQESAEKGIRPAFLTHSNVIGDLMAKAAGGEDGREAMANPPKNGSMVRIHYPIGIPRRG